jgi:uncharacterized protein
VGINLIALMPHLEVNLMSTERPVLEEMTLRQLRRVASEYGVSRYSRMRKDQLLTSIQEAQRRRVLSPARLVEAQAEVEAAKFDIGLDMGQTDRLDVSLTAVDEGLAELPQGYDESRIVLMPRDPQWAYTYWDISNDQKQELRHQGGVRLALRFYDVTNINIATQKPHSLQQYECDEMSREWYLPVPVSDREYMVEIGYLTGDGRWLLLARSAPARIPPVYPTDWTDDQFIAVSWDEDLRSKTFLQLPNPTTKRRESSPPVYEEVFSIAKSAEDQRVAGSVFSSVQQVPEQAVSSYVFPSGAGWAGTANASGRGMSGSGLAAGSVSAGAVGTMSGVGMSGVGMSGVGMSGVGMSGVGMAGMNISASGISGMTMSGVGMSGVGMSGIGMMSGVGFSASSIRPRQFWLVADAELIVYGATEPDAVVTIGGRPVQLNSDGTFRFQMSFQDGVIDFPILAIAADGEQNRAVHLKFERETPERHTNTKEEAIPEWVMS